MHKSDDANNFYQRMYELSRNSPQIDAHIPYSQGSLLVIQNPESACYILGKNIQNYRKRYDWFRQCIGVSRFTENIPEWNDLKKVTQRHFNQFDNTVLLKNVLVTMAQFTPAILQGVDELLLRDIALEIFSQTFLGYGAKELDLNFDSITELLEIALDHAFITPGDLTGARKREIYLRIFDLRQTMLKNLQRLRDPIFHKSPLLKAIYEADQKRELIFEHELMFIFSVGIETTVHSVGWILLTLAKHPSIQDQLFQEIQNTITSDSSAEDYLNLSSTRNLIDWCLRRYPPTPCISREAIYADQIGKFSITPHEPIVISLLGVLYDPSDTLESAMTSDEDTLRRNLAFGHGQRICGGKQYATNELIYLITTFIQRFEITLTSDAPIEFEWNAQLKQKGGHPIKLLKRQ